MVTLSLHASSTARPQGPARSTGFAAFVRGLPAQWRARRAARNVHSLSDEMLHDIGLTRGEIDSAVRYGRARRG